MASSNAPSFRIKNTKLYICETLLGASQGCLDSIHTRGRYINLGRVFNTYTSNPPRVNSSLI